MLSTCITILIPSVASLRRGGQLHRTEWTTSPEYVAVNGKAVPLTEAGSGDTHCKVQLRLSGDDEIRIEMMPGLRIVESAEMPAVGARTSGLKLPGVVWDRAADEYTIRLEGKRGSSCLLCALFPQHPASVSGAVLSDAGLEVSFADSGAEYARLDVAVRMT